MMATPEQWEVQEKFAPESEDAACLLELRSRVKALEVDAEEDSTSTHFCLSSIIKRLEALEAKPTSNSDQTRSSELDWITREQLDQVAELLRPSNSSAGLTSPNNLARPDRSLVERVAFAMAHAPDGFGYEQEARAAMLEMLVWLEERGCAGAADELKREI